jgi:hypothetical protein
MALPVEAPVDSVALAVEALGELLPPLLRRPLGPAIEAGVEPVAALVQAALDAIAPAVESGLGAIPLSVQVPLDAIAASVEEILHLGIGAREARSQDQSHRDSQSCQAQHSHVFDLLSMEGRRPRGD